MMAMMPMARGSDDNSRTTLRHVSVAIFCDVGAADLMLVVSDEGLLLLLLLVVLLLLLLLVLLLRLPSLPWLGNDVGPLLWIGCCCCAVVTGVKGAELVTSGALVTVSCWRLLSLPAASAYHINPQLLRQRELHGFKNYWHATQLTFCCCNCQRPMSLPRQSESER
jgi:hypothetical protein